MGPGASAQLLLESLLRSLALESLRLRSLPRLRRCPRCRPQPVLEGLLLHALSIPELALLELLEPHPFFQLALLSRRQGAELPPRCFLVLFQTQRVLLLLSQQLWPVEH
ncbi:MAG: hypothetical protein QNJ87_07845 [Gammaproteobacteria bacterium]|nr:hypothetical protein [Gammaproteobacteria bacterium]